MDQELINTALLADTDSGSDYSINPLRWMLFKVKQRAKVQYSDLIPSQVGRDISDSSDSSIPTPTEAMSILARARRTDSARRTMTVELAPGLEEVASPPPFSDNFQYNWPYDYLSFVEMVKMDANIMFNRILPPTYDPVDVASDIEDWTPGGQTQEAPQFGEYNNMSAIQLSDTPRFVGAPAALVPRTAPVTMTITGKQQLQAEDMGPGPDSGILDEIY